MNDDRIHLRNLSLDELKDFIEEIGEPSYRFKQIASWLYGKPVREFSLMTDLPLSLRERLTESAVISTLEPVTVQISRTDGTRKFLFRLQDGEFIESVFMRHGKRITLCISTQVGCPLDCIFCRTGKGRFRRNLTSGEILDQICILRDQSLGEVEKVNVVFMGMGEPLLNYKALVKALKTLNDPAGMNLSGRRITVSTAGLPSKMTALADEDVSCLLAVSLNAADDARRREIMPALGAHSISEILEAAEYFARKKRGRVTIEYVLVKGLNTSLSDADRLGRLTRSKPFKLNLIPCNPGSGLSTLSEEEIDRFIQRLLPHAPTVTVRRSKGSDIDAACGQLWTKSLSKTRPAKGSPEVLEEGEEGEDTFRRNGRG
jgi:23S rRNA (adenine2503-C2)-methyltransferase